MPADLESLLGEVRFLSERYRSGGRAAFGAFENLVSRLLHLTVLDVRSQVRLSYGPDRSRAALAGSDGPGDGLQLNDGRFLRMDVELVLGAASSVPQFLKVEKASYQYQRQRGGRDGGGWIFRYDYLRQPGRDWHPGSHLQLNGSLVHEEALPDRLPLRRIHFPVGRIGIEAVIRLLADEFTRGTRRTGHVGAGLGLSIVRAIAEAHGGAARLVASAQPGARFELLVPHRSPTPTNRVAAAENELP